MPEATSQTSVYPISVSVKWLPRVCWIALSFLVLIHLVVWTYNYRVHELPDYLTELVDVDNEQSLENGYSSFALAIAGYLTLAVAGRRKREADRDARLWSVLGVGLCAMAIEEVAGIHESINTYQGGGWTTWGMLVGAVIGFFFLPFLWRLPRRTRWQFVAAGAMYVFGEMVVQKFEEIYLDAHKAGVDTLAYKYLAAVKEGGTLVGVAYYIGAILQYMSGGRPEVVVDVRPET